jgi:excisionase family DNA binding protein
MSNQSAHVPEMLGLREAASTLGIDKRTVLGMVRRGQLVGIRIGARLWRFPRTQVERLAGIAQDAHSDVAQGDHANGHHEHGTPAVAHPTQPHATVSR